jgi:hypothetical protein
VPLGPIREVTLEQDLLGRMLHFGTVGFSTAASGGQEVVFAGIPDPLAVQRLVQARLRH